MEPQKKQSPKMNTQSQPKKNHPKNNHSMNNHPKKKKDKFTCPRCGKPLRFGARYARCRKCNYYRRLKRSELRANEVKQGVPLKIDDETDKDGFDQILGIQYCPKCELMLRKISRKDGIDYWKCRCGFRKPYEDKEGRKASIPNYVKNRLEHKTIIIEDKDQSETPTLNVICPKCGHMGAIAFEILGGTREDPIKTMFRCVNCGNRWRDD